MIIIVPIHIILMSMNRTEAALLIRKVTEI